MMELFKYISFIIVCNVLSANAEGFTHWMVTESGLIEPKLHSPFNMERPYDLLALMDQEKKWSTIFEVYNELAVRQTRINKLWTNLEKQTDLEPHLAKNKDCVEAGDISMFDWYISFLDEGSLMNIPQQEHMVSNSQRSATYDIPDCKKISSLIFSMFTFEHLESMRQRNNLSVHPDLTLVESPQTLDLFGHWLYGLLRQNTSSWLHYDMAVIYWRMKGNAPKAMECARRAVHYVPRSNKDLALLNMGNIFHQSKRSEDAIVILSAAIDHNPQNYMGHFSLATAYAITGNYNLSLHHFNQSLKLQPQHDSKKKYIPCIKCHASLVPKIENIRKTLDLLHKELHDYSRNETEWPKILREFLKTIKHDEDFDIRSMDQSSERMTQIMGKDIKRLKKYSDKFYLIKYFLDDPVYSGKWENTEGVLGVEAVYSLQRLIKHIERNLNSVPETIVKMDPVKVDDEPKQCKKPGAACNIKKELSEMDKKMSEFEVGTIMYPSTMKVNRNSEDFDTESDWPSDSFCKTASAKFPDNIDAVYPVFLPFENKGIRLGSLLTERIGVPAWEQHELPWHPPTCVPDKDAAPYTGPHKKTKPITLEVAQTEHLRHRLQDYVSGDPHLVRNMQDVEIGQRIFAAKNKKAAPPWMLLVLSSLYWRVRNNNANALHCLLPAARQVPPRYKDIVLVSLASVYLEMGYIDEAISAAEEAFKMAVYEPATNFVVSQINMVRKHRSTQLFHLKQTVRVERGFMGGLARRQLAAWACVLKHVNAIHEMDFRESEMCTQVEPGVNVVCEKGGESCYITNIRCRDTQADVGGLLQLLDRSGDRSAAIDDKFFEWVVATAPAARDSPGHAQHFAAMMHVVSQLRGCGPKGCNGLKPSDLALKETDCSFYRVQFGYWIQNIKEMMAEADLSIIPEIVAIPTTGKKIPDCRYLVEGEGEDYFLRRLAELQADTWEPLMTIAHQFAELFDIYDYVSLGSKIATYVETNGDWTGALLASWWCGVVGHGACAHRCVAAAHLLAPAARAHLALRVLVVLLHMQSKFHEAKDMAYLSFYTAPKSKTEAFLAAVSHSHLGEWEAAVWMYRYALQLDPQYLAAKACLHGTVCLMLYQHDPDKLKPNFHNIR
ncbi:tetratricopeptide repeat protein 17 [Aricia agestis]|uniref:tetratricopeptide repeat protein 17 n=1 Tax=Aricia agestis TaxID=91739 RepID=UPI001C2097CC|nr:tetratricopeptide repeat protein 17 [Aricia agestis]